MVISEFLGTITGFQLAPDAPGLEALVRSYRDYSFLFSPPAGRFPKGEIELSQFNAKKVRIQVELIEDAPRKLDTIGMLDALTAAGVMYRITNLEINGLDQNNNVTYRPKVHITLGIRGSEKFHFMGDSLTEEIARAYETAQAEGYLKPESHA